MYGYRNKLHDGQVHRELLRFDSDNLSHLLILSRIHDLEMCYITTKVASYIFRGELSHIEILSHGTAQIYKVPLPELYKLKLRCVKVVSHKDEFCLPDVGRMHDENKTIDLGSIECCRNFIIHLTADLQLIKIVTLIEFLDGYCLRDLVIIDDKLLYEHSNIKGRQVYDVHGRYYGERVKAQPEREHLTVGNGYMLLPFLPYSKILPYYDD